MQPYQYKLTIMTEQWTTKAPFLTRKSVSLNHTSVSGC